jgi:hypothetical protein
MDDLRNEPETVARAEMLGKLRLCYVELEKGPSGRVPSESEMSGLFEALGHAHTEWLGDFQ